MDFSKISLPRNRPESQGVDPSAILALVQALESQNLETHSLMVVRHGQVAAEGWWAPYQPNEAHLLYSLTKSFCSTAVGFAVAEGLFGLDDLLADHFSDLVPEDPSPNLGKVRVRHLLSMAVGHDVEPDLGVATGTWESCARKFLAHPVPQEPGEFFLYNTAASNMLSILVQKTSGETLDRFLKPRFLDPLGVEGEYWTSGADFVWGGSGLHATTETIAKLGLVYLNGGKWQGAELLPEGWAAMASQSHVSNGSDPDNDWNQGYGFQFWRSRHGAFRGDGAFGQFCVVMPQFDAVVAITSGECDMQKVLNAIWENLLPGFDRSPVECGLDEKLANLVLAPREPSAVGLTEFKLANPTEKFSLDLSEGHGQLTWIDRMDFRLDEWSEGTFSFGRDKMRRAAIRGCWLDSERLQIKVVDLATPHFMVFQVTIKGGVVEVAVEERGHFFAMEPKRFFASWVQPVAFGGQTQ